MPRGQKGSKIMIEFEDLRLRLLESEKPIANLKEALAIDHVEKKSQNLTSKPQLPDFGTTPKTAKRC